MKILRKIIPALTISLACFSCNTRNVKITLNAGIGVYADQSSCKTFLVNKGSTLSDFNYEQPLLADGYYDREDSEIKETLTVSYWTNSDGTIYKNFSFNEDTTLYAHYYNSFEEEKALANKMLNKAHKFAIDLSPTKDYRDTINSELTLTQEIIAASNSSYETFSVARIFDAVLPIVKQRSSDLQIVNNFLDLEHYAFGLVKKASIDQRCMPYIKMMDGIALASVQDQSLLEIGKSQLMTFDSYVNKLNSNFSSYYGSPVALFIMSCSQRPIVKNYLSEFFKKYLEGCANSTNIGQVSAITKALEGISAAAITEELLNDYLAQYEQFVKDVTGASV